MHQFSPKRAFGQLVVAVICKRLHSPATAKAKWKKGTATTTMRSPGLGRIDRTAVPRAGAPDEELGAKRARYVRGIYAGSWPRRSQGQFWFVARQPGTES
jgi:hypothetical protein